jgi:predicted enzyme related to lactoylglutathione lyase
MEIDFSRGRSMKPTYFDLTVRDTGEARRFFSAVLGWTYKEFAPGYFRIQAGPEHEPGIDGGIAALADTTIAKGPMTVLVMPVDDLDKMVALVESHGGHVLERRVPVPGIGWFSSCAEPGGLVFGMIQADPAVQPPS